ncbi:nitroreductase family protein [Actinomycetospora callitridis]|uniref:nitroreductase family protein n=1 Tax=Actinomycetospora callitridis TaxID=913944 RepID=UPI00236537A1|nr:nitroreductase family protein [Actinomycetospora callitridis]MDD7920022.1 nitroreductase family protein [Actinomycetospora callitridis]
MTDPVLDAIRRRRVTRAMTDEPVERAYVETILDAARWAPTAGNRHLQRYVATTHPGTLRVLRMVSPGMIPRPPAAIVICVDRGLSERYGFRPEAPGPWIDVGTATATILLAAQAVGLGAAPVSSFSHAAVAEALALPEGWDPVLIVCLGHPAPEQPRPISPNRRLTWRDLTQWVPGDV